MRRSRWTLRRTLATFQWLAQTRAERQAQEKFTPRTFLVFPRTCQKSTWRMSIFAPRARKSQSAPECLYEGNETKGTAAQGISAPYRSPLAAICALEKGEMYHV